MGRRTALLPLALFATTGITACTEVPMTPAAVAADVFLESDRADIFLEPDRDVIEARVPRRATLAGILRTHEVGENLIVEMVDATRPVFDPRRLRAGQPYRLVRTFDGRLRQFEYEIDSDRFLRIVRQGAPGTELEGEIVPYTKERAQIAMHGEIDAGTSSLVAAIHEAGEQVQLAIEIAEVFAGEIDFNNDLRQGDSFDVLFEKYLREDEFAGYGSIVAAEFNNDGRRIRAIQFTPPGGAPAYYDEEGRSLQKLFLRSPFRFQPRVTSRFSYRRLHPVLGGFRPHLGVDYGAPRGTPVIAVASGVVVSAGWDGDSGNMVRLRHANGYETYYLHLSAFAAGMRRGTRVAQGQTIGRVGATGLVTAPHLDFRMRKSGVFVNPLLEHRKLPPGEPVPPADLPEFRVVRDEALERLLWFVQPAVAASAYTQ